MPGMYKGQRLEVLAYDVHCDKLVAYKLGIDAVDVAKELVGLARALDETLEVVFNGTKLRAGPTDPIAKVVADWWRVQQATAADPLPEPLRDYDMEWGNTITACRYAVRDCAADGRGTEDAKHDVFESAMEAVFGHDIWKWWSKQR